MDIKNEFSPLIFAYINMQVAIMNAFFYVIHNASFIPFWINSLYNALYEQNKYLMIKYKLYSIFTVFLIYMSFVWWKKKTLSKALHYSDLCMFFNECSFLSRWQNIKISWWNSNTMKHTLQNWHWNRDHLS